MSDIFEELVAGGVDPQALAAALRKQSSLGQVGQLTGIPQLQALGKQLSTGAMAQASDYADRGQRAGEQRERYADRGLQRTMMQQNAQAALEGRRDIANQRSEDARYRTDESNAMTRERDLARTTAQDNRNSTIRRDAKRARLGGLETVMGALDQMQIQSDNLGPDGGYFEGMIPAIGSDEQLFDKASGSLLAIMQSAMRVVGSGSQSNLELQALLGSFPTRQDEKAPRDQALKNIRARVVTIMEREGLDDFAEELDGKRPEYMPAGPKSRGRAPDSSEASSGSGAVIRFDSQGKRVQ